MTNTVAEKNTQRIRVSMIEPVGGHGGNEFYDFGLCEAIGKYCDVKFYTCGETHLHEIYGLKTDTYKFYKNVYGSANAAIRGVRYAVGALKTAIHSKLNRAKIAHIHVYHFSWRELIVAALCKMLFIRVVATIHDVESFSEDSQGWAASLKFIKYFPFIDRYIVHSRFAYENLHNISRGLIKSHLHIVPHGDTDFLYVNSLSKAEARADLCIPADRKIILFFGQIKKVKGLDVLLDAFTAIAKTDSLYHLWIVGRPWKVSGETIKDRIAELGIDEQVTLNMSYIKNEDVPKYFVAADIVALPYLKIYSSGVLLRALDYGAPVVVSDLEPLTDIIHDGENGRVFQSGDAAHLASVIKEIIDAPALLKKYMDAGKDTIAEKYSWDVVARETLAVYALI